MSGEQEGKPPARKKTRKRASKSTASSAKSRQTAAKKKVSAKKTASAREAEPEPSSELQGPERIYALADQLNVERHKEQGDAEVEPPETWVSFVVGSERYALPVQAITEILRVGTITRVPHAPPAVLGVCNRRGRVLPVVDLRLRLHVETSPLTPASRILVVSAGGRLIGLLVDAVRQVESLLRSRFKAAPESIATSETKAVLGVVHHNGEMIVLLDTERVLALDSEEKIA